MTDVNDSGQVVDDQQGVNQVASGKSVNQVASGAGDSATAGGQQGGTQDAAGNQDKTIPYERFKEVNEAKNLSEQRVAELQAQLDLINANQHQPTNQKQQDLYNVCVNQLGLNDKEYLTTEENGQVLNLMLQYQSQANAQQAFMTAHPDYSEIVGKFNANGVFVPSAAMTSYLAKNPHIQMALRNNSQAGIVLYELVKAGTSQQTNQNANDVNVQKANEAAQLLTNKHKSISVAPGGGTLDKVEAIRNMTDEEFSQYKENIMSRAT